MLHIQLAVGSFPENILTALQLVHDEAVNEQAALGKFRKTNSSVQEIKKDALYASFQGHEVAKDNEPSSSMKCPRVQVRTFYVSSPILAANSPFFYKLFSNGNKESQRQHATLHIQASGKS